MVVFLGQPKPRITQKRRRFGSFSSSSSSLGLFVGREGRRLIRGGGVSGTSSKLGIRGTPTKENITVRERERLGARLRDTVGRDGV